MEVLSLEEMCAEFRKNCHNAEIIYLLFQDDLGRASTNTVPHFTAGADIKSHQTW